MPICTTCTHITPYLYTVYESEYNLRLEQCGECHAFVDPYVEHDHLTLLLDLILLKRGVYRHLLYNRGTKPRKLVGRSSDDKKGDSEPGSQTIDVREKRRWILMLKLGGALIFLDSCGAILADPNLPSDGSPWTGEMLRSFSRVLVGTFAETFAFHLGIMLVCYMVLHVLDWLRSWRRKVHVVSNIRQEFRLSLIPLSLFYSSLTKLFLLFLLTIWLPASPSSSTSTHGHATGWEPGFLSNTTLFKGALEILDDDKLDREWIVRNVLGGMSAGFGLRVILDIHPVFTTIIILAGWAAKTAVAGLVSRWVGGDEMTGEAWLAYSIP